MDSIQIDEFKKKYHHWSDTIKSFDFRFTPPELRIQNKVSDEDFKTFISLPYSRDDQGIILINEAFTEWELLKDLLLSLDRLPDSLLLDIYKMDSKRYQNNTLIDLSIKEDNDETKRQILNQLIPEIIWAHSFKK